MEQIIEDFRAVKELVEGEILKYETFPPKDELERIRYEVCLEAIEKIKKYYYAK